MSKWLSRTLKRLRGGASDPFAELKRLPRASTDQVRGVFSMFEPFDIGIPLIRIGGPNDGGYLLPDDLSGIKAAFSPGVEETVGFDAGIAGLGIPVFMADASVTGIATPHPLLTFDPLFLGAETAGDTISMADWIGRYAPDEGDLLLQMDIEGAEYEVLGAMTDADLGRFRIIVMELHGLEDAFTQEGNRRLRALMARLNDRFVVCHIHPNNYYPVAEIDGIAFPRLIELTLLRRDRIAADPAPAERLPHPLDEANVPQNPDWPCPFFWRGYSVSP